MPNNNELLKELQEIGAAINRQIPLAANRYEEFERTHSYVGMSEEEIEKHEEEIYQKLLVHEHYLEINYNKFEIYNHINREFTAFLVEEKITDPTQLNTSQRDSFKIRMQQAATSLSNKIKRTLSLLGKSGGIEITELQTYLATQMDALIEKLCQGEKLKIEDNDLALRFEKDSQLAEERNIFKAQALIKLQTMIPTNEDFADNYRQQKIASVLSRAVFLDQIKTQVGNCDEHTVLGLLKISKNSRIIRNIIIEKISIQYLDENNNPNDGHTFLAINRDPNSELSNIPSWNGILFDPWNQLVCDTNDFEKLPHHYFSYPEGAEWSTLKFTSNDFSMIEQIDFLEKCLLTTGNYSAQQREKILIDEYQLISLQQHEASQEFIDGIYKNLKKPKHFNHEVTFYLTTVGRQPVRVLNGFNDPTIAIHTDFLLDLSDKKIPGKLLEFAILRALYFIKHFSLLSEESIYDSEHIHLDKLTIDQCHQAPIAIQYLRYCCEFYQKRYAIKDFNTVTINISKFNFKNLGEIGLAYLQRIKAIELLLAREESLRNIDSELLAVPLQNFDRITSSQFFFQVTDIDQTKVEKINSLTSQLENLRTEFFPYEMNPQKISVRLKEFCHHLTNLKIDLNAPTERAAVDHLLNTAFDLRIPSFEYIYFNICGITDFNDTNQPLPSLGPFKTLQIAIDNFVNADTFDVAIEAAKQITICKENLKNHFVLLLPEAARNYRENYLKTHPGQDLLERFFGSTIGVRINWNTFSFTNRPWARHLTWCRNDESQLIAKTLWLLGIVRDKEIWSFFSYQQLTGFTNYRSELHFPPLVSADKLPVSDDYYFTKTCPEFYHYEANNHKIKTKMFDNNKLSFEQAFIEFYDQNLSGLAMPEKDLNTESATVHFLLKKFLAVVQQGNEEDKKVVKSFFLGRKDNRDLPNLQKFHYVDNKLSHTSSYIKFFILQEYNSEKFELFTENEILEEINNIFLSIEMNVLDIPAEWLIQVCYLSYTELSLECIQELIPRIHPYKKSMSNDFCASIIKTHLIKNNAYPLFSAEALTIIHLANHYIAQGSVNTKNVIFKSFIWPNSFSNSVCGKIALNDLITIYKTFDVNLMIFPSQTTQQEFSAYILERLAEMIDVDKLIPTLEKLLFIEDTLFNIPLSDLQLRNTVTHLWINAILKKYGKDTNQKPYYNQLKSVIDHVHQGASNRETVYILNHLTKAITAQKDLCDYIGILLDPKKYLHVTSQEKNSQHALNILAGIANYLGKKREDQLQFIDFLSSPLTAYSCDQFAKYLEQHTKASIILKQMGYNTSIEKIDVSVTKQASQLIYYMFWDRTLDERAVIMDYLLLPPECVKTEETQRHAYQAAFTYAAKKLFPNAHNKNHDDNSALAFLEAYLNAADEYSRKYLLSGMIVASCESQASRKVSSAGKKLALLCEHLGPAYVKLAQAIHSHPQTPEYIRNDLNHVKGRSNPPLRWDLWRHLQDTLPIDIQNQIDYLGEILGSASYNIAIEVVLKDGTNAVLLLLRENAKKDAKNGFIHLKNAVTNCHHEKITSMQESVLGMLNEADKLSTIELSYQCGDQQNLIASNIYNFSMDVTVKDTYHVHIKASKTICSGQGYRIIERVYGIEFNDLPEISAKDAEIRKAIAKVIIMTELNNILSGNYFDCDRHGNQLRVLIDNNQIYLGLYDFGEMELNKPNAEELGQLRDVIRDFPMATLSSIDKIFSKHIDRIILAGQNPQYIMRVRKALLAVQDFQKLLSPQELLELQQSIIKRNNIHPIIKSVYISSVDKMSWFVASQMAFHHFSLFAKALTTAVNPQRPANPSTSLMMGTSRNH